MLYAGALSYFAANDVNLKMLNKGKQALAYRQPSLGTFSTSLNPIYSFGVPRQVEMSGIRVDMDAVAQSLWARNNDVQIANAIGQQVGMMTSAWEHRIPEMLFTNEENPGEAVSAVKALAIASAEGQRIYQVTQENVNAVLPVLNISSEVKDEIRASIAASKVATVSQNNITVGSWTGVGYIIADPDTGAGAYRISGGSNGGTLDFLAGFAAGLGLGSILGLTIFASGIWFWVGILAFIHAFALIYVGMLIAEGTEGFNRDCYYVGGLMGLFIATIAAAGLYKSIEEVLKSLFASASFGFLGLAFFDDAFEKSTNCLSGS